MIVDEIAFDRPILQHDFGEDMLHIGNAVILLELAKAGEIGLHKFGLIVEYFVERGFMYNLGILK